jgi:hypothetical protein
MRVRPTPTQRLRTGPPRKRGEQGRAVALGSLHDHDTQEASPATRCSSAGGRAHLRQIELAHGAPAGRAGGQGRPDPSIEPEAVPAGRFGGQVHGTACLY